MIMIIVKDFLAIAHLTYLHRCCPRAAEVKKRVSVVTQELETQDRGVHGGRLLGQWRPVMQEADNVCLGSSKVSPFEQPRIVRLNRKYPRERILPILIECMTVSRLVANPRRRI